MTQIDAETLQELIDAHGGALVLFARQWCQSPEDAVQEALIQLVRQDPPPQQAVAWLYTCVRRRAINLSRGESRRARHQRRAGAMRERWFLPDEQAADAVDLERLIATLPRLQREILVARIWGGLSFAEIADVVALSVSSAHRGYHDAIAALQKMTHQPANLPKSHESRTISF